MKALTLLLLRLSTGIYLILWGLVKLVAQSTAVAVSDKYYFGLLNADLVNYGIGGIEILTGVLVILGLFRGISYAVQAVFYLIGLLAIAPYIIDPFGAYLVEQAKLTFFPSTTLLFASLIVIAFKEFDTMSVDHKRSRS